MKSGMIALVGETNAGKSTLLNALFGRKLSIVASKPHTTRNRVLAIKNSERGQLVLVDTPGLTRASAKNQLGKFTSRVLQEASSGVDVLLLVVDAASMVKRRGRAAELLTALRERRLNTPAIVALNKIDLLRKDLLLPLMEELYELLKKEGQEQVELVPVSALKNDGLDVLERLMWDRLPEGDALFPEDVVSDQSEEFLTAEIIREKLLAVLEDELPHALAVRIEEWEEDDDLLQIRALILVERDTQKAIVIGKGGSRLKEIGQLAREELEERFQTKIFLKLFVKVEADWTKTERGLARAGYEM